MGQTRQLGLSTTIPVTEGYSFSHVSNCQLTTKDITHTINPLSSSYIGHFN